MSTILIVEDERLLQQIVAEKFIKEGFQVERASDGQAGLDMALRVHPDLILLDMILPKLDGMAVLRQLRVNSWGKNVPVIILSNTKENDKIDEAKKLGVKAYLTKTDWELEGIVEMVKMALNGQEVNF